MQHVLRVATVAALSLATAASPALPQEAGGRARFPLPAHVLHDTEPDGTLWALGRTYKASADARGFTYVPYLGADAPRCFPVAIRVASVEVGGRAVALDDEPRVTREGDAWTLDRGPVDVVYELALDSVEQIFVVDDVSAGGAVRVSLEVESELVLVPDGEGLRFVGDHGEVRYGAAIAIAPDGCTCAVAAEPTARGFDLVVPAEFVASIDGPLVVDPVFSSGTVNALPGIPTVSVDVASDPDVGFVAAIERTFSVTDGDVFLYTIDGPSSTPSGTFAATVDLSLDSWEESSVAGRDALDEFLVVATRGSGAGRRIWAREATAAANWTLEPKFALSSGREAFGPDVGADHVVSFFTSNHWMAVWEERDSAGNSFVRGRVITTDGPLSTSFGMGIPLLGNHSPCISETAGPRGPASSQAFTVAFLRDAPTIGTEIVVDQRGHAGVPLINPYVAVPGSFVTDVDIAGPSDEVAPNGEHPYLLVYGTRALFGNGRWVRATVAAGFEVFGTTSISDMSDEGRDRLQRNPVAAAEGDQFVVVYEESDDLSGPADVVMCSGSVANGSFGLAERRQFFTSTPFDEGGASVTSLWEGGSEFLTNACFAAWTNADQPDEAEGGFLAAYPLLSAGHQFCEATLNSGGRRGWIAAYGNTNVTDTKRLIVWDAAPTSACFVLVSREEAFVPLVAGSRGNLCLGGNGFGRFSNFLSNTDGLGRYELYFDPQAIAQPNGSVGAVPGETWYFQAWFRDSIGGAATSNLTNGVAIPFE